MTLDVDVIFMAGPQGSGKGTQSKRLAKRLDFFLWDMGAILRGIIQAKGPLWEKIDVINHGQLLGDEVLIQVLERHLPSIPEGKGVIFDGVPRRMGQAQFLIDWLRVHNRTRLLTISIDLSREESIARLKKRATIEGRADDTMKSIERRLDLFEEDTVPVLAHLKNETRYIEIDGRPSIEEVEREIDTALGM